MYKQGILQSEWRVTVKQAVFITRLTLEEMTIGKNERRMFERMRIHSYVVPISERLFYSIVTIVNY